MPQPFKGPTMFAVYGGPPGGPIMRINGTNSVQEAQDTILLHQKSYVGWTYSIWQATGWKEIKQ